MCIYRVHVSTKFEANRSKNTATVAQKPPKWTFLRRNVATLLRHDVFLHMIQCAYTMSMYPPNLKQIGRKTRPQWPKTPQNGRFYVITSRRRYVITFFPQATMRLYHIHVCTKFEANRLKNTATVAQKPPKRPKMDVFTS